MTRSPPAKPKMPADERRARQNDQFMRIRFRVMIERELAEWGTTTPAVIGAALGMAPAEETSLLSRHQWCEGDLQLWGRAGVEHGLGSQAKT